MGIDNGDVKMCECESLRAAARFCPRGHAPRREQIPAAITAFTAANGLYVVVVVEVERRPVS